MPCRTTWLHVVKANTLFSPLIFSIVIIANGICGYVHDYIISNGIMEGIPNPPTCLFNYLFTYFNLPNPTLLRFSCCFHFFVSHCLDLILVVIEWFKLCNRHKNSTFDLSVFKVQSFSSQHLCFFLYHNFVQVQTRGTILRTKGKWISKCTIKRVCVFSWDMSCFVKT